MTLPSLSITSPEASVATLQHSDDLVNLIADVQRFVSAFVRPITDAEDVTAETFRAAIGRLRFPIPTAEARAWLLHVARKRIADHHRRKRRQELPRQGATPDPDLGLAVRSILAELPEDQAAALIMKYALGLSTEETAKVLKRSAAATQSLLQRARAAFAERGQSLVQPEPM